MKHKPLCSATIFFMTIFYRPGGRWHGPLDPLLVLILVVMFSICERSIKSSRAQILNEHKKEVNLETYRFSIVRGFRNEQICAKVCVVCRIIRSIKIELFIIPHRVFMTSIVLIELCVSLQSNLRAFNFFDTQLISSMTGDFREIRRQRYGSLAITAMRWHPKTTYMCYAASADGKVIYCNSADYTTSEIIKGRSLYFIFNLAGLAWTF